MEHLDDRDRNRVVEDAAQTDTSKHNESAAQECITHANFAHNNWHNTHHGGFHEYLNTVECGVGAITDFFGWEQVGVVGWEHLLIENRIERVSQQHKDDEQPQGWHS